MLAKNQATCLGDLESAAKELRPDFQLDTDWSERVLATADPERLLAMALEVLRAEATGACFDPEHFRATLPLKAEMPPPVCELIVELIARCFVERVPLAGVSELFGPFDEARVRAVTGGVAEAGFAALGEPIPAAALDRMARALDDQVFQSRLEGARATGRELTERRATARGVWWATDIPAIAVLPELQALALDPFLVAIAQESLRAAPIHVQTNSWWSFPPARTSFFRPRRHRSRNAQMFHRDQEFLTFVKMFVHFSDVEHDTGPHVYVTGSHREESPLDVGTRSSKRRADKQVVAAFGKERIRALTGARGSIAVVNTRGFHKGGPVRRGHRHLVQLEYASSMFFNPVQHFDRDRMGPLAHDLSRAIPRTLLNYR